jgi:large subunit ribosomal protein L3
MNHKFFNGMKFILGQKVGMSQIFASDGRVVSVTLVKAGPCQVTQVKNQKPDGYQAIQIGFGIKKSLSKPLSGHLKILPNFRYIKEFRSTEDLKMNRGQQIKASIFEAGDKVKVVGVSKGKGFQGVVKRHGFHGQKSSHGHKDQLRMPGSIGSTDPGHVFPGTRMAGRMGGQQVTLKNLEIVKVEVENDLLYIKGAVPGANSGLLLIQGPGELKLIEETPETKIEETLEKIEPNQENN